MLEKIGPGLALLLLGLGSIYYGIRHPQGDAWAKSGAYIFSGVLFGGIGAIMLWSSF
jgi:hypothetical protein